MNEKILLFLLECGAELVKETHNGKTGTAVNLSHGQLFDFEKFAQLIIIECAEIALREEHDPYECIKKHFGVEE